MTTPGEGLTDEEFAALIEAEIEEIHVELEVNLRWMRSMGFIPEGPDDRG